MGMHRREGSARLGLAALLHDLGKMAERARVPELLAEKTRLEAQEALVCPEALHNGKSTGRRTHKHAAWTSLAFDYLEAQGLLPQIVGEETWPFAQGQVDDSLANVAAMHHRPSSFLQWIVATADRMACGFERSEFETYNQAEESNHYTTRLRIPFEGLRLDANAKPGPLTQGYPLRPLTASALFPQTLADLEPKEDAQAQAQYRALWDSLLDGLRLIPLSHRQTLSLWLDHFETLWLSVTQAIPSATAFGTIPDVSLYDHSKATASLATALWRYHADLDHTPSEVVSGLARGEGQHGWDEKKFLLVQGDFFGIQDFVFADGSQTQKHAAKILRGRSFSVSLLCDLAALRILEELELPGLCQIINAAGKFLLVAPNTPEVRKKLSNLRDEIAAWFLEQTYGQVGIGLAWCEASPNDFLHSRFNSLLGELFDKLEEAKLSRFGLCASDAPSVVFQGYLDACGDGNTCAYTGKFPARTKTRGGLPASLLASDQIRMGEELAKPNRLILVSRSKFLEGSLYLDYFGYHITFASPEEITEKSSPLVHAQELARCWDLSLPSSQDALLWQGYARRWVNAFVPRWAANDIPNELREGKYRGCDEEGERGQVKSFEYLACEDRYLAVQGNRWKGQRALGVLKGDVDNLGALFQRGMEKPTFARWAGLSRQLHFFFAVHLPSMCASDSRFANVYTVFAGGDDFFLIGPWKSILEVSQTLRMDFSRFVKNDGISFSSGVAMAKPGMPLRHLADLAECALESAKGWKDHSSCKNAVSAFGRTVPWGQFFALMREAEHMRDWAEDLSHGFVYNLLHIADMAESHAKGGCPENGLWASRLAYQAQRNIRAPEKCLKVLEVLLHSPNSGIRHFKGDYRIALSTHLYQQRDA